MKALFAGPRSPDYLLSGLHDGFQEVLGEENVVTAADSPWLHASTARALVAEEHLPDHGLGGARVVYELGATREGRTLQAGDRDFDLLVIHSSFNRDHDWPWCRHLYELLKPQGKVAYVEGWDAATQVEPPRTLVDAVFRKEIDPRLPYPYCPIPLTFGAPSRWLQEGAWEGSRPLDVFWSGNPSACHPAHPVRAPMLGQVFRTRRTHHSVIATFGMGWDTYFGYLRKAKLALCPSGADDTDSLRTMEAVACGAVPVFVGYPDYTRDPWFDGTMSFSANPANLPDVLDEALAQAESGHLEEKRRNLVAHVRRHHTTAARARRVLEVLGMS